MSTVVTGALTVLVAATAVAAARDWVETSRLIKQTRRMYAIRGEYETWRKETEPVGGSAADYAAWRTEAEWRATFCQIAEAYIADEYTPAVTSTKDPR